MLAELQQQLSDIYRVGRHYDVRDYVITDPALAKYLGQDAILTNTDETLLVCQDDDGLALSLFLDGDMLERVESTNPLACLQAESLDDLWKVLEGISHFNCVVWKAAFVPPHTNRLWNRSGQGFAQNVFGPAVMQFLRRRQ